LALKYTENQRRKLIMSLDLDKTLKKNRVPVIVGIIVLLAFPLVYGVYNNLKEKKQVKYADQIFAFSQKELKELRDGQLKPSDFINSFSKLQDETSHFEGNFPILLEAAEILDGKNELAAAKEILELGQKNYSSNYEKILIGLRLSAVYEDLGENDKAITLLEEMANSKVKILEGKIYLDLGRLYKKSNNPVKAKEKFQYVLNNFDEEVYKKLAQLNLQAK
jgi:predicted negative regulator of RcsB-dependent stress response